MVNPSLAPGDHNLFICGNDAAVKSAVANYLSDWSGWKRGNIVDLGHITGARGTEMYLPLWVRLWGILGTPHFNVQLKIGRPA
jgi:8-hydroxy-5-deazaflavin:NADPH oxidoreductase